MPQRHPGSCPSSASASADSPCERALTSQCLSLPPPLQAYAPQYPFPKEEAWYFILGDTSANAAMCLIRASLVAAEAAGARAVVRAVAAGTDPAAVDPLAEEADAAEDGAAPRYQEVSAAFRAPLKAGRHVLTLACLPDSCLGCDRAVPIKVRVVEATRAEREGRAQRLAAAVAAGEDGEGSWEQVGASDAEEGSESGSEREEEVLIGGGGRGFGGGPDLHACGGIQLVRGWGRGVPVRERRGAVAMRVLLGPV